MDLDWYDDLVTGIEKPIVQNGYINVPEKPGIGVELNEEVVRERMDRDEPRQGVNHGTGFFEPTPEWDEIRSWDRLWS